MSSTRIPPPRIAPEAQGCPAGQIKRLRRVAAGLQPGAAAGQRPHAFSILPAPLMLRRFDQPRSPLLSGLGFIEEVLPFTDAVPTFCIGWCLQNLWPTTPVAQKMRIGVDTVPPAAAKAHENRP